MTESYRDEFEAMVLKEIRLSFFGQPPLKIDPETNGYWSPVIDAAWIAWQAAIALIEVKS